MNFDKIIYWLPMIPIIGVIWIFLSPDAHYCVFDENGNRTDLFWISAILQGIVGGFTITILTL